MSKGSATTHGYYVEARCVDDHWGTAGPPKVGDQYLSGKWLRLRTQDGPGGVTNDIWDVVAYHHHVLTYAAARAIMARVAANFSWRFDVEFRLVKVKVESSYEITEEGHSTPEKFDFITASTIEFTPVDPKGSVA